MKNKKLNILIMLVIAILYLISMIPSNLAIPPPPAAQISIIKTVDFDGDEVYGELESNYSGETAHWKITVTNIGYSPVYDIYITDDNGQNYGPITLLNHGDSQTFDYDTNPTENFLNEACAQGVDQIGRTVGPVCDTAAVIILEPSGCTYTAGYWMTHSQYGPAAEDPTWMDLPDMDEDLTIEGPDEIFYENIYDLTWHSIMNFSATEAKALGLKWNTVQVYQQLAFQYVAAYLNGILNGYLPSYISKNLSRAEDIFKNHKNMEVPKKSDATSISSTLYWFNEGCYPGWPHCNIQYGSITIKIYNDKNANSIFDNDDEYIADGWDITRDSGPCKCNPDVTITTDSNGEAYFDNLKPGIYTITIDIGKHWSGPEQISVEVFDGGALIVELPYQ